MVANLLEINLHVEINLQQYSKTEYFINLFPMQIENFKMLI